MGSFKRYVKPEGGGGGVVCVCGGGGGREDSKLRNLGGGKGGFSNAVT